VPQAGASNVPAQDWRAKSTPLDDWRAKSTPLDDWLAKSTPVDAEAATLDALADQLPYAASLDDVAPQPPAPPSEFERGLEPGDYSLPPTPASEFKRGIELGAYSLPRAPAFAQPTEYEPDIVSLKHTWYRLKKTLVEGLSPFGLKRHIADPETLEEYELINKRVVEDYPIRGRIYTTIPKVTSALAEYATLRELFRATGLAKLLNSAGQKLAAPFVSKELATTGAQATKLLSRKGVQDATRRALVSFLASAPENVAFVSSWRAAKPILQGRKAQEIADAALGGAGWGAVWTGALSVLGGFGKAFAQSAEAKKLAEATSRLVMRWAVKYPVIGDWLAKGTDKTIVDAVTREFQQTYGVNVGFTGLPKRVQVAIRLIARRILRVARQQARRQAQTEAYMAAGKAARGEIVIAPNWILGRRIPEPGPPPPPSAPSAARERPSELRRPEPAADQSLALPPPVAPEASTPIKPKAEGASRVPIIPPPPTSEPGPLRQKIHAVAKARAIPEKMWRAEVERLTGKKRLRDLEAEDLQKVLEAVRQMRPEKIRNRPVVTLETESRIETLKNRLMERGELTEEDFARQMEELGLKTYGFLDKQNYATEDQARELIKKMNDEAPLILRRARIERGLEEAPGIKQHVDDIAARLEKKRKPDAKISEFLATRHVARWMEEQTGKPFYDLWQQILDRRAEISREHDARIQAIEESVPNYDKLIADDAEMQRVEQLLAHRRNPDDIPYPEDISPEGIALAEAISKYGDLADYVRQVRFQRYYDFGEDIPDAPQEDLDEAVRIYETEGRDALNQYLATRTWGTISRGYVPLDANILPLPGRKPSPTLFGKGWAKTRKGGAGRQRPLMDRVFNHIRSVLNVRMEPEVRAFWRMLQDNIDQFEDPRHVAQMWERAINEAKGYQDYPTKLERFMRRAVSQFMAARFVVPRMPLRNLLQNPAFNKDAIYLLKRPGTAPHPKVDLSPADLDWFETYVTQIGAIHKHYLLQGEKPFFGLRHLTEWARKLTFYSQSDNLNRLQAYAWRLRRIREAAKSLDPNDPKSVAKFLHDADLDSLTELEQKHALELLASEGVDAMARYAAAQHVLNVHFPYDRPQRSFTEMGSSGRAMANLFAFARGYVERLILEAGKVKRGGPYAPRLRALRRLLRLTLWSSFVGAIYASVVGSKYNPYNPLRIIGWAPYGIYNAVTELIDSFSQNLIGALQGDKAALRRLVGTIIPQLARSYAPLYDQARWLAETLTGTKNIDRLALRRIIATFDKTYKVRTSAYKANRDMLEAFQHALSGYEPPPEEPAEEPPARKKRKTSLRHRPVRTKRVTRRHR